MNTEKTMCPIAQKLIELAYEADANRTWQTDTADPTRERSFIAVDSLEDYSLALYRYGNAGKTAIKAVIYKSTKDAERIPKSVMSIGIHPGYDTAYVKNHTEYNQELISPYSVLSRALLWINQDLAYSD